MKILTMLLQVLTLEGYKWHIYSIVKQGRLRQARIDLQCL